MGARLLHGALNPGDFAKINAILVFKKTPHPDGRRLGVEGNADAPPREIARMLDPRFRIDGDETVAENL